MSPRESLQSLLDVFNYDLSVWEANFNNGANFEWFYTSDGSKRLRIKDVAPVAELPEDKKAARIIEVIEIMEKLNDGSKERS